MLIAWLLSAALGADCTYVRMGDIKKIPPPAVIVLGERHGEQPDLRRAGAVVRVLSRKAPVTLALEAVHRDQQGVLDRFASGRVEARDLSELMAWETMWGFDYGAYAPLVTASRWGAQVVGVGLDLGPSPVGAEVPLPPRYIDLLRPAMGGHDIPYGMESSFVQAMAWRDHSIAKRALQGWDRKGYVVLVTGRGHVEGGLGVGWQAEHLVDVPVHSIVLKAGDDPPCHEGDRLWK